MFGLLVSVIYISLLPVAALGFLELKGDVPFLLNFFVYFSQFLVLSPIFMFVFFKVLKKVFGEVPEFWVSEERTNNI